MKQYLIDLLESQFEEKDLAVFIDSSNNLYLNPGSNRSLVDPTYLITNSLFNLQVDWVKNLIFLVLDFDDSDLIFQTDIKL